MIETILTILVIVLAFLLYSVLNNIFWVDKGGEHSGDATVSNELGSWKGPVKEYSFKQLVGYVFGYRVFDVIKPKNYRDYLTTFIMTSVVITLLTWGIWWAIAEYMFFILFKLITLHIWKV